MTSHHFLAKPDNIFTLDEYRQFLSNYYYAEAGNIQNFLKLVRLLPQVYLARLPKYLLAKCPFCAEPVWEAVDSFSLNGMGWKRTKRGYGWYGTIPEESLQAKNEVRESSSYETKCVHIQIVSVMVNLNGIQPDDVTQEVWIGSERPFVMSPVLNLEQTYAVIHSLPVGRYDDVEPQPHYTAYFVSYFTDVDRRTFDRVMQPAYEAYGRVLYDWADYGLMKWVQREKLFWLDPNDPDLPLRNKPASDFPYGDVKGGEGLWVIRNGRMQPYYSLKPMHWSGGEWQPEPGFLRRLAQTFRPGRRDRKK